MRKIGGVVYMDWRVMIQDGAEENKVRFSSIQCIYLKDGSCL